MSRRLCQDVKYGSTCSCFVVFVVAAVVAADATVVAAVSREQLAMVYERTGECLVDLASDQTSCHNPYGGGYYPVQVRSLPVLQVFAVSAQRKFALSKV